MNANNSNYKLLRKIQEFEKKSPLLSKIDPNFYSDIFEYLDNLNDRLKKETSSQKKILLDDEIKNTFRIITNIYENREKKIILSAISKSRGGNPNIKNLLDFEKNLFDSILESTISLRNKILNIKFNKIDPKNRKNLVTVSDKDVKELRDNSKTIVRVIKDIPKFIGTDTKEYNLKNGDFLSLPKDMVDMLLKRGVIEVVE
jgi:DNA replication factor GINS